MGTLNVHHHGKASYQLSSMVWMDEDLVLQPQNLKHDHDNNPLL